MTLPETPCSRSASERSPTGHPTPDARHRPPEWVAAPVQGRAHPRMGRYLLGPLLGHGGMGRVFEAWDASLMRVVAVKILYRDSPEAMIRLVQEAQFQARVQHPNIGPIYEVDLSGEQPVIVMQRIYGPSLEEVHGQLGPEALVAILEASARAVHTAHLAGLIHRDIKPSNILLEALPDGSWHPYVMDFGLARELDGPLTSRTQMGIGTPAFAAPEQAEGMAPDVRSDVYGLGATLYMALAGVPPIEAGTMAERRRALEGPGPLRLRRRDPALSADLETLVATCLALDPSDRYASALALAEDLERFRTGRPLWARPRSRFSRMRRLVFQRRRQVLAGLLLAGFLAGAGAFVLRHFRSREAQILLMQRYGREAEQVEETLRAIRSEPRHDLDAELGPIRARVLGLQTEVERLPPGLAAPGHLALGRMFLALREEDEALVQLQKAQLGQDHSPQLAQSLGCALGLAYDRELQSARLNAGTAGRQALEEQLRQRYLGPIEALLGQALGGSDTWYLKGLIAHYRGQEAQAVQWAQEALRQTPGRTDVLALLAEARLGQARQCQKAQDAEGARLALASAEAALVQGERSARSDPALPCLEADVWTLRGLMDLAGHQSRSAQAEFSRALGCAQGALELQASAPGPQLRLARGHFLLGVALGGADRELLQAEAWAERLIRIPSIEGEAQRLLGRSLLLRAEATGASGGEAEPLLQRCNAALDRAAILGQPAEEAKVRALLLQARMTERRGQDANAVLEEALQVAEKARGRWGDRPALSTLAETLGAMAECKERRGEDARGLRERQQQVVTALMK